MDVSENDRTITLTVGHAELVIRRRYELVSISNDVLIGIWFLIGSILFLHEATTYAGTWMFIAGSIEMLVRPVIRLSRRVHLQHISGNPAEADHDF
ncbi:hypothetical protein Ae168Ps1_0148c [Pseudonocardia sp. Ae168_Ps1]|uniref:YrhK family protein n=1 Tax=unclassified Pseudonocardia TaxID=2619320 RepID=UPI0006CB3167|nr:MULTISPECIES: YrhK family protein [unclassified Pseudonocardia]ALE73747.1 hypothetical protein FRP1_13085 [Pseudonocardia sp. EC080625-04]ALL77135.1 hypothetical protein AD006_20765 [Pseudonocardia sp. EC080610-09]ALL80049.1 hypothetical protein AD017_00345 [Pseudonocardia sp. EC080619-01]OLL71774.1 hypothetical protein Ae150APs1_0152c [Pseudonocardia sp. Ae150A_Ps1]OLL77742.1 hypothetical protein Ae168Ps1_0148c [Pseudonocardia sp. Ae168_Ps1]